MAVYNIIMVQMKYCQKAKPVAKINAGVFKAIRQHEGYYVCI